MVQRRGYRRAESLVLLFGLLTLALPGVNADVVIAPPAPGSAVASQGYLVPAALAAPFSERAGYLPTASVGVQEVAPASGQVTLTVSLWPSDMNLFAAKPGDPVSPSMFESRYSPSPGVYAGAEAYFESHGWSVTRTWSDRLSMTLQGPATAVHQAFGTTLLSGDRNGNPVTFLAGAPSLPGYLESEIAAVSGLSTGFISPSYSLKVVHPSTQPRAATPAQLRTTNFTTPIDTHLIYDMDRLFNYSGSPHWSTGNAIALVLWGWGYDPADLTTFFSQYYPSGFPAPNIVPKPVDGAPAPSANAVNDPSGAPLELTLDMEWAGSSAPGATLYPTYAPDGSSSSNGYAPTSTTLEDALHAAIGFPNVRAVSMSFGLPEGQDPSLQATFELYFSAGSSQGITFLAASGDTGGAVLNSGACTAVLSPQYPATSPQVIQVGGTEPIMNQSLSGSVTGLNQEPAWPYSGGGFSQQYPAPSWQQVGSAKGPIQSNGNRGGPDVAGPASYNFIYYGGRAAAGRGTSFASPLWAGIVTEMDSVRGAPFGFLTPRLYSVGAAEPGSGRAPGLVDITSGTNCVGTAGTGWDVVTGWGTPRVFVLYAQLTATFVNVSIVPNANSVVPGGSVGITVIVQNATTGAPISNLNVTLSIASTTAYVGPCGGTMGTVQVSTNGSGAATGSLNVANCFLGSHAVVTALVLSKGLYGQASTELPVNLVGLAGFLALIGTFPYNVIAFAVIVIVATAVGIKIGNWRHRTRGSVRRVVPTGALRPAPATTAAAGPRAPAQPSQASPSPGPKPAGVPAASTPVSVPAHVLNPPTPAPSVSRAPGVLPLAFCENCGALLAIGNPRCPSCGSISG